MKETSRSCIAITLYVCILEVFGSNFGRDTGYPGVLHGFIQSFREYISNSTILAPFQTLPNSVSANHRRSIMEILAASLNKQ